MREELVRYKGKRVEFVGEFQKMALTKIRRDLTALFNNVRDIQGEMEKSIDHVWVTVDLSPENAGLGKTEPGEVIKFGGFVHAYTKHDGTRTVGIDEIVVLKED